MSLEQDWIQREEHCSPSVIRRVAAMLDLEPADAAAGTLPRGWHFVLMAADTRRSSLRADGFPGLGVPMPDLGLPRLMLGSRRVSFHHDIPIGAAVSRRSRVEGIVHKTTSAGPMATVAIAHELRLTGEAEPAIQETQTYVLLPPRGPSSTKAASIEPASPPSAQHVKTVLPDETLLFQYSALGFNSHRIHLDRTHAREVEGYPDLVVNGGLATLLLTEFLRQELGAAPHTLSVRHVAPLYCNRPTILTADPKDGGWHLMAFDDSHRLTVDMEASVK